MSERSKEAKLARKLREQEGFDQARVEDGYVHVGCSQCDAVAINGHACHEQGCPNKK